MRYACQTDRVYTAYYYDTASAAIYATAYAVDINKWYNTIYIESVKSDKRAPCDHYMMISLKSVLIVRGMKDVMAVSDKNESFEYCGRQI